eukprot:2897137-Ditylum_brightwellii.AAC.1
MKDSTINWDNGGDSTPSKDQEWGARSKDQALCALLTRSDSARQTQYATINRNPTISSNWTEKG